MQYDRKITISAGNNRRAMNWTPQSMLISELWAPDLPLNADGWVGRYFRKD